MKNLLAFFIFTSCTFLWTLRVRKSLFLAIRRSQENFGRSIFLDKTHAVVRQQIIEGSAEVITNWLVFRFLNLCSSRFDCLYKKVKVGMKPQMAWTKRLHRVALSIFFKIEWHKVCCNIRLVRLFFLNFELSKLQILNFQAQEILRGFPQHNVFQEKKKPNFELYKFFVFVGNQLIKFSSVQRFIFFWTFQLCNVYFQLCRLRNTIFQQ